jgi:hypothetical protein
MGGWERQGVKKKKEAEDGVFSAVGTAVSVGLYESSSGVGGGDLLGGGWAGDS